MITHEILGERRGHQDQPVRRGRAVLASLTGPGRVWLQTLPFSRLAERIASAYKSDREDVKRDFGGALGRIGDLIGGE